MSIHMPPCQDVSMAGTRPVTTIDTTVIEALDFEPSCTVEKCRSEHSEAASFWASIDLVTCGCHGEALFCLPCHQATVEDVAHINRLIAFKCPAGHLNWEGVKYEYEALR